MPVRVGLLLLVNVVALLVALGGVVGGLILVVTELNPMRS